VGHQETKMHIQSAREKEERNGKREFSTDSIIQSYPHFFEQSFPTSPNFMKHQYHMNVLHVLDYFCNFIFGFLVTLFSNLQVHFNQCQKLPSSGSIRPTLSLEVG
jgi:hypothetical protein